MEAFGKIMKLYHGTSSVALKMIMKRGIRPRGKRRSLWREHPSAIDRVYLTRAYAVYFACHAAMEHKGDGVVLEVDVPEIRLVADEDALAQITITDPELKFLNNLDLTARTEWWKRNGPGFPGLWETSLRLLGNCAHMGIIFPKQIMKMVQFKVTPEIMLGHDPVISIMNYKFMGEAYMNTLQKFVDTDGREGRQVRHPVSEALFQKLLTKKSDNDT
jgi:hypothetical protein